MLLLFQPPGFRRAYSSPLYSSQQNATVSQLLPFCESLWALWVGEKKSHSWYDMKHTIRSKVDQWHQMWTINNKVYIQGEMSFCQHVSLKWGVHNSYRTDISPISQRKAPIINNIYLYIYILDLFNALFYLIFIY